MRLLEDEVHQLKKDKDQHKILFICFIILLIVVILFCNIVAVGNKLYKKEIQNASAISEHLANNISYRLIRKSESLQDVKESFEKIPESSLTEELLEERAKKRAFEGLAILSEEDIIISRNFPLKKLQKWKKENLNALKKPLISFIDDYHIIFSMPLLINKNKKATLIGVEGYSKINELLSIMDLKVNGGFLIVGDNKIVFQSKNMVNEIKQQDNVDLFLSSIKEKLNHKNNGIVDMTEFYAHPTLVSYHPLEIDGWALLTIIPRNVLINQRVRPIINSVLVILISVIVLLIIIIYLINTHKKMEKKLERLAFVDPVTGGMNNASFQVEFEKIMLNNKQEYAIVFLDIKDFTKIDDQRGMVKGNKVLNHVYKVLKSELDKNELVARSEGDHFFLMIKGNNKQKITKRISRLLDAVNFLSAEGGKQYNNYHLEFHIGVYMIDDRQQGVQVCQTRARCAAGLNMLGDICRFYDDEVIQQEKYEEQMMNEFEKAIENHEFLLYLQPKIYISKSHIAAAEALVRWNHPDYGLIFPSKFISLLEKKGKLYKLDLYMFEEVCKLLANRMKDGLPLLEISVNISYMDLKETSINVVEELIHLKNKYKIPDQIIELEITETVLIEKAQLLFVTKIIHCLHENGIRCALDDFGFGYSSLGMLHALNIDTIKLDRQFFLNENEKMWKVIDGFIDLAHRIGVEIVAEGIESLTYVERLKKVGCDLVQGYVYAKPMSMKEFKIWLLKTNNGRFP